MTRQIADHVVLPYGQTPSVEAILADLQARTSFPLSALLAVTEKCNLRCRHCYQASAAATEMTLEQIEQILDAVAGAGVLFLTITGGEPAIRADLEGIIEAAVDRRFAVKLKTNGTLLDRERIARLSGAGLAEVHLSLYDDRPAIHDAFVGLEGAWRLVWDTVGFFRKQGVGVQVACNAMAANADRVSRIVDLCEAHGATWAIDLHVSSRIDGDPEPCRLRATEEQVISLLADRRLFDPRAVAVGRQVEHNQPTCGAGTAGVYIRANGDVQLCPFLPLTLGNALATRFDALWMTSQERRQFLAIRWGDLPDCAECEHGWACTRCPGMALREGGSLLAISPSDCQLARARILASHSAENDCHDP